MIDLNPFIPPATQKKIGPLSISDRAAAQVVAVMTEFGVVGHEFRPTVAATVVSFLDSPYFAKSEWFRRQPVHTTLALKIEPPVGEPVAPVFHLQKTKHGHVVVACDEAPLSEMYFEQRVIEETKVEIGIT